MQDCILIKTVSRTHALPYMIRHERSRIFTKPQVWLYAQKKIIGGKIIVATSYPFWHFVNTKQAPLCTLDSSTATKKGGRSCYLKSRAPSKLNHNGWLTTASQPVGVRLEPSTDFLAHRDRIFLLGSDTLCLHLMYSFESQPKHIKLFKENCYSWLKPNQRKSLGVRWLWMKV